MTGTLGELEQDIRRLSDMGVTELVHSPPAIGFSPVPSIDAGLALMEQLIDISR